MAEALTVRGLGVVRDGAPILAGVSFAASYGSILAILGPNGAGKTTLLDALAGFLPYSGELLLDGKPLARLERRERARRLAYVPQQSKLDSAMRVRDVVAQGRFAHAGALGRLGAEDHAAVDEALAATDAAQFGERSYTTLSAGEKRRVLLARALATGARVVLLDEPSAALDIRHALALFALLRRLADSGHGIVVVLHQLDEALRASDRALLLDGGRVHAAGPTAEVIAAEPVRRVYGVELVPQGAFGYRRAES